MLKKWDLRSAFVFFFPVFIGLIFYFVFSDALQRLDQTRQKQAEDEWLTRANIMAARVRSEHTGERQAEKAFRAIAWQLEKAAASSDQELPSLLIEAFQQHLPHEIADKTLTWAFIKTRDKFELLEHSKLMNQKKRAFLHVFEALARLAVDTDESIGTRNHERFIAGMFGENSAPQYLATDRQGRLTPVVYENGHYYLCWRQIEVGGNRFLGFISLLPGAFIEDEQAGLQRLANKIYSETNDQDSQGLTVFINSLRLDHEITPVMPEKAQKNTKTAILIDLLKKSWGGGRVRPRQINRLASGWLFFDHIEAETPYSVAIITPPVETAASTALLRAFCAFSALMIWTLYFVSRLRTSNLSILSAFRLLFFLTGMLPVAVLVVMVLNLIDESADSRIRERINYARETLQAINERYEDVTNWCGVILGNLLKTRDLQRQLGSTVLQRQGFDYLVNQLAMRNYSLQYMLVFMPGEEPRHLTNSPSQTAMARFHLDYFAVSCEAVNQLFALYNPRLQPLKLSSLQKTLLRTITNIGPSVAREIFLHSIERMTCLKTGNAARNFFYNCALVDDSGRPWYMVFSVSIVRTFSQLLETELMRANRNKNITFACFNRNLSAAQKVLPASGLQFMHSQTGKAFHTFVDAAASSQIGLILREPENIFVYEPMLKTGRYYGGAVIEISDLARETGLRRLLLLLGVAALSLIVYVLSTAVAKIFIEPTCQLSGVFSGIATGNYQQTFAYEYNNELGELATATNNMIAGLKERHLLGKFVSTTFDSQISSVTASSSAQKLTGVLLFSDVRSFTTLSEANSPVVISQMLNAHLRSMVEAINSHGGRVDQFIGDAVVAFFPGEGAGSCSIAVNAAAAMMRQHRQTSIERQQHGLFTYNIGIGLAYGTVIAGILSSGTRSEFTIIGKARSVAERLETQSKTAKHTGIIVSAQLFEMLAESHNRFCEHQSESYELIDLDALT
ncbi:MAG: adenylate cyclase [uncultured bacterium]|nr:MAG: adenylate cyclase [uncultured bacterium]